jgi:hypothetical protein
VTLSPSSCRLEQGMEHGDCVVIPPYSENGQAQSVSIYIYICIYVYIYLFVKKLTAVFLTTAMRCISNRTMYTVSQQSHTEFLTNEI